MVNNGNSRSEPISGGFQILIRLENAFMIQNEVNIPSSFKELLLKAKQNATVKKIRPDPTFLSKSTMPLEKEA